jgi:hypothetical protein
MRPSEVKAALKALRKTNVTALLEGEPGTAKSAVASQVAAEESCSLCDIRMLLHEPSDIKFPMVNLKEKRIEWVQSIFPTDPAWEGIVVLEEIDKCPPLVQASVLGLLHERKLGDYTVPDGCYFMLTANKISDGAGANKLITPLMNRVMLLAMEVSNEDWQAWALEEGIDHRVRSYLNYRPAQLHQFKPGTGQRAFPSPRSWEYVSRVLPHMPDHLKLPMTAGLLGEGTAAEFIGYLRICDELPNIDSIIKDPKGSKVPKDMAVGYALCGALAERCKDATQDTLRAIITYHSRMTDELSVLTMREMYVVSKTVRQMKEAADWLRAHKNVFSNT